MRFIVEGPEGDLFGRTAVVLSYAIRPCEDWGREETWGPNIFCTLEVRLTEFLAGFFEVMTSTAHKSVRLTQGRYTMLFEDAVLQYLDTDISAGRVIYDTSWVCREVDRTVRFADYRTEEPRKLDWRTVGF